MRTTRTLSISLSPQLLREAERLAKEERRTMSELVREALRRYQQERQQRRETDLTALAETIAAIQAEAKRKGVNKLTMREISQEIAAYRREKRAQQNSRR